VIDRSRLERIRAMESGHFWSVGRDRLTRLLMARCGFEDPILDAGAGTGHFARTLLEEGRSVYWFDVGPVSPPGFVASVTNIPVRDGAVGTVLARDVIEHVDDGAAMREICRVLRPGGHALVTVPGWPSLWSARDERAGHRRRYRRRDLRRLVEELPLEVLLIQGYQFLLLPAVIVSRLLNRLQGTHDPSHEERPPPRLNRMFRGINTLEARLSASGLPPPTGSSLIMVARRI
jgi:SAM-dependent methyltransferase